MNVIVYPTPEILVAEAATRIKRILLSLQPDALSICLTGGETAADVYRALAAAESPEPAIAWRRLHVFWGDERDVPPDHADSNYGMATSALLAHVPVDDARVHRIEADGRDAEAAALKYDALLQKTVFAAEQTDPAFDVMLLGLGADAHIASIFPGSPLLTATSPRRVASVPATHSRRARITLTPETVLASRRIIMVVSGASKAAAVHAALDLPEQPTQWPSQILRQAGDRLEWLMDSAAARSWRGAPPGR